MSIKCENERGFDTFLARHCNSENELGAENILDTSDTSIRRHHSPEPGRAILSCGSGSVGPMPLISTTFSSPMTITSVTIDTTRMCNPRVLLSFTGLICLPANILISLNFIIEKSVNGGAPQAIGTHTFTELAGALESKPFCFQHCDCSPLVGGTTYTVKVQPSSFISETAGLTINGTLSALAVETLC